MELLYIFIAPLVVILLGALLQPYWRRNARSALPPGPPLCVPILGHLPNLFTNRRSLHQYFAKLTHKYGPILFFRLGSMPMIVISSPQLAKEFLLTHDKTFANRPTFTSAKYMAGIEGHRSITLLPYGEEWRGGRKLYSLQLFSTLRIHEFQSHIILREIHHLISNHLQPTGRATLVNLTDWFDKLLENIICSIIFQQRPSEVMVEGSLSLSQLTRKAAHLISTPLISDFLPWLDFMDSKLKVTMKKWRSSFTAIMNHIINERKRTNIDANNVKPKDILDVFLLPENNLSEDLIQVYIAELLSAGIDSSSTTLDWAMSELLANPHVLAKLRAELDQVVGIERCVNESDIPNLPYLQAVTKETFRKHPPGPLLVPHMSSEATRVGGYMIPKGTMLFVNVWAIGHDPKVWKDPEVFMPERFLRTNDEANAVDVKGHHFELLPFGSGRRICPAMSLAMSIVHLTLSTLVHTLEWELPPGQKSVDMSERSGVLCHRLHPLLVPPPRPRTAP